MATKISLAVRDLERLNAELFECLRLTRQLMRGDQFEHVLLSLNPERTIGQHIDALLQRIEE